MRQSRLDSTLGRLARKLESRVLALVLPEATDERVLAAARVLRDRQLAQSVLIGAKSEITAAADAAGIALDGLTILDPQEPGDQDLYVKQYLELRPGSSPGIARRLIRKPLFLGGSLLRANQADAMLAGVSYPTARVIEACLMTVGLADGIETPSSCFLMIGSRFLRLARTYSAAFAGSPISSAIFMTFSAAPPCAGPDNAPMAAVTAANTFAPVPVTTRAAKDEAFEPCSACRIRSLSISVAACSLGRTPFNMYRKFAA